MDKQIKTIIKILATLLSVFLVVVSISFIKEIISGKQADSYPASITVTATGEVKAIPNVATFSFGVSEKGSTVSDAQSKMNEKVNKILAYIKEKGVEDKDMETTGYNAYPTYDYINGKQVSTGYQTSETVSVKIKDTKIAGEILSKVGEFGVTDLSGLSFTTDDKDELKKQATNKAIENAKQKAEDLSKKVGFKLKKIIGFYEEVNPGITPYPVNSPLIMEKVSTAVIPEIKTGESTITSTVSITYEIK